MKKGQTLQLTKDELQKELKKKSAALERSKKKSKIREEAQAREAQIEAALEKVRSRSLAMHKSDELHEIVKVLFEQLRELDILLAEDKTISIVTFNDDKKEMNFWITWEKLPNVVTTFVPYTDHAIISDIWKAKEKGQEYFSKVYPFEEKNKYWAWAFEFTSNKDLPEGIKKLVWEKEFYASSFAFAKHTGIYIPNYDGIVPSEKDKEVLIRFAKVFEQSYVRFLDLQKAEAQAREAQIEAALERVRGKAMSMMKSEDLLDICQILFEELQQSGLGELRNTMINIYDDDKESFLNYDFTWNKKTKIVTIPYNGHSVIKSFIRQAKMKSDALAEITVTGKELESWKEFRKKGGQLEDPKLNDTTELYYYFYSIGTGAVGISHFKPISKKQLDLLKRFRNVFELCYRRYIDVVNAEAQARESQIQLALERVRARTMAMQKSNELSETVFILFRQFKELGENPDQATIGIINEDEWVIEYWVTMYGNQTNRMYKFPIDEPNVTNKIYKAWKEQKSSLVIELSGKELYDFATFRESMGGAEYNNEEHKRVINVAFFSKGLINVQSNESRSVESIRLLERFAGVFEQTYARFLDLQKAETQAREAQIEAALERVRSRTMGMQKSEELKEVIQVVYEQFLLLNIKIEHTGFVIDYKARDDYNIWIADPLGVPSQVIVPYFDSVYYNRFNEAKEKGEDFFATNLAFEEKNRFYKKLFEYVPGLTEETKEFYFSCPGLAASTVLLENVCLYIENFSGIPYSNEENSTLMRFGKVFQQTYTRFLDLQRAEAQAREAKIEAALERVRSRSMAMYQSTELNDVAIVLFQQLRQLGGNLLTCGIVLCKENSTVDNLTMAVLGGGIAPNIYLPNNEEPVQKNMYEGWKSGKELYTEARGGEELKAHYDYMMTLPSMRLVLQILIASGFPLPTWQKWHAAYFSHGYLLIITLEPYAEEQTFKRLAKVFEQTYTRFLDLQKAETQAREATKQASLDRVRGQIASMRSTEDLQRITPLIWHELTMLGVPFIRCGVFIMDEEQQQIHTFLSTPEGKAIATLHVPFNFNLPLISNGVDHWRKGEIYKEHWDTVTFIQSWKALSALIETSTASPQNEHPPENLYLHQLPFLQGMLYVGSEVPLTDEAMQLSQNLADAFSTAYARYEDFNKLEAANIKIEKTLVNLKQTQAQLVQSEKMASLGEVTAGIAHEIQNPLNFVNNFSEVNVELLNELKDGPLKKLPEPESKEADQIVENLSQNLQKIAHHGKRADAIVKGMLQHSRNSSDTKEPTDINALADEYLRLSYHGLRAKDKDFNSTINTDFDKSIGKINIIPQEIGRVLLNLYNNAFYAVTEKKKQQRAGYEPTVSVSTKKFADRVEIRVKDNGNGIPSKVVDKIFHPFFTTKPTGQGTGLGLSLSYDIVKAHVGEINVNTTEGEFTELVIHLPVSA